MDPQTACVVRCAAGISRESSAKLTTVPTRRRKLGFLHLHGFTLVELLVVVGLIAVLTGLLLPVFSGVRSRARQAECSSKLREVCSTIRLISTERRDYAQLAGLIQLKREPSSARLRSAVNDSEARRYSYVPVQIWPGREIPRDLPSLLDRSMSWTSTTRGNPTKFRCALEEDEAPKGAPVVIEVVEGIGFSLDAGIRFSYAPGNWIFGFRASDVALASRAPLAGRLSRMRRASSVLMIAESGGSSYVHAWVPTGRGAVTMADERARLAAAARLPSPSRHRGRFAVGYVDGHVSMETMTEPNLRSILLSE